MAAVWVLILPLLLLFFLLLTGSIVMICFKRARVAGLILLSILLLLPFVFVGFLHIGRPTRGAVVEAPPPGAAPADAIVMDDSGSREEVYYKDGLPHVVVQTRSNGEANEVYYKDGLPHVVVQTQSNGETKEVHYKDGLPHVVVQSQNNGKAYVNTPRGQGRHGLPTAISTRTSYRSNSGFFLLFPLLGIFSICFIILILMVVKQTRNVGWTLLSIVLLLPLAVLFWHQQRSRSEINESEQFLTGAGGKAAVARQTAQKRAGQARSTAETARVLKQAFSKALAIPSGEESVSASRDSAAEATTLKSPCTTKKKIEQMMEVTVSAQLVNAISQAVAEAIEKYRKSEAADERPATMAAEQMSPSAPPPRQRPDWIDMKPRLVGEAYRMYVSVGPYTDRLECDAHTPEAVQKALDYYVGIFRGAQWEGKIRLPREELLGLVVDQYEEVRQFDFSPMIELHLLVQIDRKVKGRILEAEHALVVQERLHLAGMGFTGALVMLGMVWSYLRLDQRSGGRYRGRLRAVSVLFLLAAAVVFALALRV